jgi:hypothetical protein
VVVCGHHAESADCSARWDGEDISRRGGGFIGLVSVGLGDGDSTGNWWNTLILGQKDGGCAYHR